MKILATGMSGLVGQRIKELLTSYEFISISRKDGQDISRIETIEPLFASFLGDWVLHMGAKADVDGCEKDKKLGKEGEAWKVNVLGTDNICRLAKKHGKKLIYISTDFVFDGIKTIGTGYTEEDKPNPIDWYGETKYQGEILVQNTGIQYLILRIAYPYGVSSAQKKDFVRNVAERIKNGQEVKGITDHVMCPTFIDDIALVLKRLIEKNQSGLFHLVGATPITPYDSCIEIARALGVSEDIIKKTTREEYFANRAPRPFNLELKNDKIESLGIKTKTFQEGLINLKNYL